MITTNPTFRPTVGNHYHLSWASPNRVWILKQYFSGNDLCVVTTKRGKDMTVKVKDLRILSAYAKNYKPY